jgi:hypothetical protein
VSDCHSEGWRWADQGLAAAGWEVANEHAVLVSEGLFWLVIFITLLLAMFVYVVIATRVATTQTPADHERP